MAYISNKSRVLSALRRRKRGYTAHELADKLDMGHVDNVYSTISTLRSEGYEIVGRKNRSGRNQYSISY